MFMGKRGPKPQFTDVACPNDLCEFYGFKSKGNVVGNGTSMSRGEKVRKYICCHCGKYSMTIQGLSIMISVKKNVLSILL
jgi:hypothetical protein